MPGRFPRSCNELTDLTESLIWYSAPFRVTVNWPDRVSKVIRSQSSFAVLSNFAQSTLSILFEGHSLYG
jgi:hypothetical protein